MGTTEVSTRPDAGALAAIALSVIAVACFLLQPQISQAAVESLHYSERMVGVLAAAVLGGQAIAAIAAAWLVRRVPWRPAAFLGLLGLLVSDLIALIWHQPLAFIAALSTAGLFGGFVYSLVLTMLSDGAQPDRLFGYSVAAQVAFQVLGLLAGPTLVGLGGIDAMIGVFVALDIAALLMVRWLPDASRTHAAPHARGRLVTWPTTLALTGCFLFFFNVGCYWTYVEVIGTDAGLPVRAVADSLAFGVAFGVPGALLASWMGDRAGRLPPIAVSAVVTVAAALLLLGQPRLLAYTVSAVLYNIVWNLSLTYQFAIVNSVDRTGRGVAAAPAFLGLGGAAGPAVAALLVQPGKTAGIVWLTVASVLLSLACFFASARAAVATRADHPAAA